MRKSPPPSFGLKAALSVSVGLSALMASGLATATAQDGGEEAKRLGVVTVTAGKREQTLQDIPVAVSVVDNQVVERAAINDIIDLQSVVPSLRVSQLQQSGNSTFIIRGFGNGGNNIGIEPSVAVFIDGVYRTRASGGLSDYSDIERIEVLRGPQSTLFGKNASVGVISVITEKPQFDFGGKVEATIGNYDQRIVKGSVTGPIADKLAFSLSGSYNTRDGYADNEFDGTRLNDRDRYSIKGQLLFEPSDDLSFRFIADYDQLDEICCYAPNAISGPTEAAINAAGGVVITDPFGYRTALDINPTNEISNQGISAQIDYETGFGTITSISSFRQQDHLSDGDVDFTSLQAIRSNVLDYDIDTLTQELRLAGSTDKIDYVIGGFYFNEKINQRSNVLFETGFYDYGNALAGGAIPGIEALLGFAPRSFFAPGTGSNERFTQDNDFYSLFAQADYHVTDRLTATFGVAYVNDEKTVTAAVDNDDLFASLDLANEFNNAARLDAILPSLVGATFAEVVASEAFAAVTGTPFTPAGLQALQVAAGGGDPAAIATLTAIGQTAANPAFVSAVQTGTANTVAANFSPLQFLPGFLDFPNAFEDGRSQDDKVTFTGRLAYDVNDSLNVYASYATGYKASSWNLTRDSSYPAALTTQLAGAGLIPTNRGPGTRLAGPEDTEVFELGAKLSLPTLALNVAVFDQTIEGFQSTIFQGTGFVLANAGQQSTQGIEWDATWNPIDPLTLTFAGIVQDPVYDEYVNAPGPNGTVIDLSGEQPAGISETSLFFGAQYEHDFANGMTGFIRGDYVYESDVQAVDNIVGITREVGTLNGSVGLGFENGLDVQVWARNLNNDEYAQSAFPTVAQAGSVNIYPNQPRTYGVTLRKQF